MGVSGCSLHGICKGCKMILPTLFLIVLVLFFFSIRQNANTNEYDRPTSFLTVSTIFSIFLFFINILVFSCNYTTQIKNIEQLQAKNYVIQLNESRVNQLTEIISTILLTTASEHEKEVYKSMSSDKITLFAVSYPQLQANTSFMKYCDEMTNLSKELLMQKQEVASMEADIRYFRRNVMIPFHFWLPVE